MFRKAFLTAFFTFALGFTALAQFSVTGVVVGIHDGDSITVLNEGTRKQYKIRLAGIDAPEVGQDYADKAKEYLSELAFGKTVKVTSKKTDRYGRTVGKVKLGGRDLNFEQLAAGFAWHYTEYESELDENDRTLYKAAELHARKLRVNIWSMPNAVAPWEFRNGRKVEPGTLPTTFAASNAAVKIIGNKNSHVYHWPGCPSYTKVAEHNQAHFNSTKEAEVAGYRAAKNCTAPKP